MASSANQPASVRVVVIGAGFAGLIAAIELKAAGIEDFVVLDRGEELGGTWRDNTYPGCACDVPTHLYSLKVAPKPDWTRLFAPQAEIHEYMRDVAARFRLHDHIRLGTDVLAATWDEDARLWRVETSSGDYEAQVVIAGTGPWHEPVFPKVPGLDRFEGAMFHSSRWDHDHDLTGERVAVLGTGASSVQFVPEIQPRVERLHLYQRTPHWVLPKPDRALTDAERALFRRVPATQRLMRGAIHHSQELVGYATRRPWAMRRLQRIGERHLERSVPDPALRERLTPRYTLGCKRILFSNEYYRSLTRPNVDVIGAAVTEIRERSVVGGDGVEREVDAIVLATGFRLLDLPIAEIVRGRDGRSMAELWQGSPRGYLGTTVSGFPNLFVLLGPNLGNGHSSATVILENQMRYVIGALRMMDDYGLASVDVREEAQRAFNERVDERLAGSIWNAGGCASYYLDSNGRNSFMYPWSTRHYRRETRRFDVERYVTRAADGAGGAAAADAEPALA